MPRRTAGQISAAFARTTSTTKWRSVVFTLLSPCVRQEREEEGYNHLEWRRVGGNSTWSG